MRCWFHRWKIVPTPVRWTLPETTYRRCEKCGEYQAKCEIPGWAISTLGWQRIEVMPESELAGYLLSEAWCEALHEDCQRTCARVRANIRTTMNAPISDGE